MRAQQNFALTGASLHSTRNARRDQGDDLTETENTPHVADYLRPIWGRKWLILFAVVIATGATYFYFSSQPKVYTAETLVFTTDPGDPATEELRRAAVATQRPGMKVITGAAQKRAKSGPFVDRPMVQKRPTAYICRGTYCHPPVQTQQAVSALLES